MDAQGRELDSWKELVEKVVNVEAKALLQLSLSIRKIDLRYFQRNKPTKKEEKDSEKNKSTNSALANTPNKKQSFSISTYQTSSTNLKKD